MRPDVQALEEIWNRRSSSRRRLTGEPLRRRSVTEKQLALLDEWARRHDGYEWAARLFQEAPIGTDPLQWAKLGDRRWKHDRRRSASQEDGLQASRTEQAIADRLREYERLSTLMERSSLSEAEDWEDEEQELDESGLPAEEIVDLGPRFSSPSRDPLRRAIQEKFPDIAALEARGWTVSDEQRRSLDEIAERHDVTGRSWAAQIIQATPPGEDPLRRVFDVDRAWQAERRSAADRDERRSARQSQDEREEALRLLRGKAPMQPISAVLPGGNLTDKLREQGLDESLFTDKPKRRKRSASEDPAE